jgi:hypothetical protein
VDRIETSKVQFLLARLAEEEESANTVIEMESSYEDNFLIEYGWVRFTGLAKSGDKHTRSAPRSSMNFDPKFYDIPDPHRVLREVAAKRQIVALMNPYGQGEYYVGYDSATESVMDALLEVYRDHPEFPG